MRKIRIRHKKLKMKRYRKLIRNIAIIFILVLISIVSFNKYIAIMKQNKFLQGNYKKSKKSTVISNTRTINNEDIEDKKYNLELKREVQLERKVRNNLVSTSNSYNAEEVVSFVNKNYVKDGKKVVFLTFDDGPSTTVTPLVLDTLKRYNVNATFFLIGKFVDKNEESKDLVRQIVADGNAVGCHSYSHETDYNKIDSLYYGNKVNVMRYMNEVDEVNESIGKVLGVKFSTRITRMPGGHMTRVHFHDPNLAQFDQVLKARSMYSIDWNAYDIDAEGYNYNANRLLQNTERTAANQEKVVLLMHDTYGKEETAKALPKIIEYFKSRGYEFRTIK